MTDDYNPLITLTDISQELMMSVIGPMKKFDPSPIPFQSVPIETESEKIRTRLIGIGIGVTQYLDTFPNISPNGDLAKEKMCILFSGSKSLSLWSGRPILSNNDKKLLSSHKM